MLSLQTSAYFLRVDMESSDRVVLASLVAQVRGIMFYDLAVSGAFYGDRVYLVRRPHDRYDANCLDVRVVRGRPYLVGHLVAPVAAFQNRTADIPLFLVMKVAAAVTAGGWF